MSENVRCGGCGLRFDPTSVLGDDCPKCGRTFRRERERVDVVFDGPGVLIDYARDLAGRAAFRLAAEVQGSMVNWEPPEGLAARAWSAGRQALLLRSVLPKGLERMNLVVKRETVRDSKGRWWDGWFATVKGERVSEEVSR